MRKNLFAALAVAALLFASNAAFAGDPVPGIDVKITNAATGAVLTTRTDADGKFSLPLSEGKYTVCISEEACKHAISTKGTGVAGKSYSAGHFQVEVDNVSGIAIADLDGDGAADRTSSKGVTTIPPQASKYMDNPMKSPRMTMAVTERWTATKPGFSATVLGKEKHLTGHVTLIK